MGILASILTAIAGAYGLYKYGEYLVGKRIKPPVVPAQLRESYDFRYSTLAGAAKRVSDLKGKVVFVNFWGTWCIPCVAEMPTIQKLYDRYKNDTGVAFVLPSRLDDVQKLNAFSAKYKYSLPFSTINDTDIPASMNFQQYPVTFIYAKDGSVAMKHINAADWSDSSVISFIERLKAQ